MRKHGQENCDFIRPCIQQAYQIQEARKIFRQDIAQRTPESPASLDAATTPREAYLGELSLENSTHAMQELDEWAFNEAKKVKGGCNGCPIVALCVQINEENL